ncbi:MAG: SPOR domain-containing protein [Rhodanobacter sp.]|nr:MAG: SPOR domain-containing protein [Rhodanobacter sp.]TAM10485.1 MAG: SPOR domain-containing protein [Rhodanobacter sp.]TAM36332.1 MAG: SPOR domain-containing protein [Rhodanobacter sp.]
MFLRLLFVLLVTLNIVVGAWLFLGQPYPHVAPVTNPGVPELHLLSEVPASAATTATTSPASPAPAVADATSAAEPAAPSTPAKPAVPAPLRCLALGPFATPHDLQQARNALTPYTKRTRSRQEQVSQSRSWWVYLPASPNRAQAIATTRQLADKGINDYFVVSGSDQPNTVSLGLFHDQDNAKRRRAEVVAAGFPARVTERTETVPQYWLDLVTARSDLDWRTRVKAAGVGSHTTRCF